jgi:hypothetical protein
MAHQRNTEGLASAARNRRQSTIKRVNTAIQNLAAEKKTINFNSVAKAANVGKTWLYKEIEVKEKILSYRDNKAEVKTSKTLSSSNDSKDALLKMLKERVKKVESENNELKKQIEVLYGQLTVKG